MGFSQNAQNRFPGLPPASGASGGLWEASGGTLGPLGGPLGLLGPWTLGPIGSYWALCCVYYVHT